MRRTSFFVLVVVSAAALFGLYRVKYEVQALRTQVIQTARELESERESLNVAAAEWAYLNRPDRLRVLADKYLSATGVTSEQIAELEAVPIVPQGERDARVMPAGFSPSSEDSTP